MKKIALGLCVFCLAFGLPFANGEKEGSGKTKNVEISFMLSQAKWKDVFTDMAEQIKKDTGLDIEFQVVPDDQYYPLLKTKLTTGEVPDVFMYNVPMNNVDLNTINNTVDLGNEPWVSRLSNPNILKDPIDGKIYAMPFESSSFFGPVYYNKKVFRRLNISETQPKTYEEFLNVLRKIKSQGKGIVPVYMCEKDSWTTQVFTTLGFGVALSDKKEVWNKLLQNKIKWSDVPEFRTILNDFMKIYNEGLVNADHLSATYDMAKEAVAEGRAAMLFNGEWALSDIESKYPDADMGAWIIPFMDKNLMGTGAYVQGLFIPKRGNVAAAKKLLEIWAQPEYQALYWAAHPGFPGFKDVDGGAVPKAVDMLVKTYILTGKYAYQMNDMVPITAPIQPELWKYYVEMTAGMKTPEQVLKAWDVLYTDYMKARKEPGF